MTIASPNHEEPKTFDAALSACPLHRIFCLLKSKNATFVARE